MKTLHYKLLPHTLRGILTTRETPLLDIDSGYFLSFDLPSAGEYVAVLTGQDEREHTLRIGPEPIPIPAHLVKPQLIAVTVLQIKDSKPFKRWICPAIRFASLAAQGKLMLEAMPDLLSVLDRVNDLELQRDTGRREIAELRGVIAALEARISAQEAESAEQVQTLTDAYNASVTAYNAAEERITLLEAAHDPARI